ncbi:MAG: enoyl-CoA hydratase [Bacteroidetes bacterium OLB9]|nr:MAG: enoyl-CoA hydratase [Bacteroidetes bacterium OLB9]
MGFANVINAIRRCSKIVIGRIHGKAVGGGVGLAAACDYAMANKYASVRLSELAVGIGPFVIGPAVERKIGLSAFSQMALNATEWQTAAWAKQKGLFTEVFESTEQLDAYIDHFMAELITKSPEALGQLKKIFWDGTEHWEQLLEERAEMSGKLILSDFAKNAIRAFLAS